MAEKPQSRHRLTKHGTCSWRFPSKSELLTNHPASCPFRSGMTSPGDYVVAAEFRLGEKCITDVGKVR